MSRVIFASWVRAGRSLAPVTLTLVCLLAIHPPALRAQGTADLVGTVTDNSGSVVPGAKVTVRNLDTNLVRSQVTEASGQYSFTLLPVGNYSVTVEVMGFKAFTDPQLVLATGDRVRFDASLQVGEVSQSVEVEANAVALQTDNSTVGVLVTSRAVQERPQLHPPCPTGAWGDRIGAEFAGRRNPS